MEALKIETAPGVSIYTRDTGALHKPPLLLLHSLSDNGRIFDAVLEAGINDAFRCIVPDLRGRGRSSRPAIGYSLEEHCDDLLALLDHLDLKQVAIAGHSFGGLLALYFAARHPERVSGLALIDAAAELNPLTPGFVLLLTERLGRVFPSAEDFLLHVRAAPYMTDWDERMRTGLLEDTETLPDGSVAVQTQKHHIAQAAAAVQGVPKQEWRQRAQGFTGNALVLLAEEPFLAGHLILPEEKAVETAVLFPKGSVGAVPGNHVTMLFKGAGAIAEALIAHLSVPEPARRQPVFA